MRKLPTFLVWSIVIFLYLWLVKITTFALDVDNSSQDQSDRYIIKYKNTTTLEERLAFHRLVLVNRAEFIPEINAEAVSFRSSLEAERILSRDSRLEYFEPDFKAYALEMSNDPSVVNNAQWNLAKIQALSGGISGWDYSKSSSSVNIAVLDTGIDPNHEDLKNKIKAAYNCTSSPTSNDLFGHGTHVAGIAASETNNNIGVAGVGYQASLMNVKGLGDDGSGYYSWIASCIIWAVDHGANIINMSLGGPYYSRTLEDAVNYAWNKGAVIIAAAGNSGANSLFYPAAFTNAVAVAATDTNDNKASFSNFGLWVRVAAPGVAIYSTLPSYRNSLGSINYGNLSGTSMASPHVAGLAALLFSLPGMSNSQVVNNIQSNADRIYGTGYYWKYGRINALNSLRSATNTFIPIPTLTPVPSLTPSPTPTQTPSPTPTMTVVPTITLILYPTKAPTPTSYNPWSRWCGRYPFLCR